MARWGIFLLLGCALVVKASYLYAYAQLPFLLGPVGDSTVYLAQAAAVRAAHFADPTLLAFSPLYGYTLAAFSDPFWLATVQLLLGLANIGLVYWAVDRRFGWAPALLSAALYWGYGLIQFYETKILSETLGLSLALCAMVVFLSPGFTRARWMTTVGAGLLVGLAALARASLVFGVPLFALAALAPWAAAEGWSVRLKRTAGLLIGMSLLLGGYGSWTQAHGGPFVLVRYVSPSTSNLERTTSTPWNQDLSDVGFGGPDQVASAWDVVDAVARDLERRQFTGSSNDVGAIDALGSIDVTGWVSGAPDKIWRTLSDTERTFQYGYYAERLALTALDVLPVTFHVLLCLGLLGAYWLARDEGFKSLWPYMPWFLGCLMTTTLYHPSSRYRLAMVIPLVLLAGWGAQQLVVRARERRRWALLTAVAVLCIVSVTRTMTYELQNPARWELTQAASWLSQDARGRALSHISTAIELAPEDPSVRRQAAHLLDAIRARSATDDAPAP